LLAACGKATCPPVQYEGRASDEAYLTMVDAQERAFPDPSPAPAMKFADGTAFAAAPPPSIEWSSSLTAALTPRPLPPSLHAPQPFWRGWLLSEAWAHLPPVTGAIFWLLLDTPGQSCRVEVLTTNTSWTPQPDVWASIAKGTGPTTLNSYSAYLNENRIMQGPYVAPTPSTFTVAR
jgi:hypothetical protein